MDTLRSFVSGIIVTGMVVISLASDWSPDSTPRVATTHRAPSSASTLTEQEALRELSRLERNIHWQVDHVTRRAQVALNPSTELEETLPGIDEYSFSVDPVVSPDDVVVEVFVTTVRSGKGTDGRMVQIAEVFNASDQRLSDGRRAKVKIRQIASGTGYQFIASGKYLPDAFSPVHHLWIEMARDKGIPMTPIRESMVKTVAGMVLKTEVATKIEARHGKVDVKTLIGEVVEGNLAMGYTNPFASSAGLNFLATVLSTFAEGDESKMLSREVISTFEAFQRSVPFVAMTTLHMRESVRNQDGSLDAFIMGHQMFSRTPELAHGYEFVPFGVEHAHPFYAVDNPDSGKMEVLELLASFAEEPRFDEITRKYGWNQPAPGDYRAMEIPPGSTLIRAQRLWKEKKDAGRPISAIFLCDVSGSMSGSRLQGVKDALVKGSAFISPDHAIGLATFNDGVTINLPIKKFDLLHRASFVAAVEDTSAEGKTAMYNGIAIALKLLAAEKQAHPEVRPMLFVLTDGQTMTGITYERLRPVIKGMRIPIYTIGYEAKLEELKRLSGLVEAASINAGEGQIQYKIGSLLNAQM